MYFLTLEESKRRFFKRKGKLPIMFVDDRRDIKEEPLYYMIRRHYSFNLDDKYIPHTVLYIPDQYFDIICTATGRDPIEERRRLVKEYWDDIKKILDK